MNNRTVEHSMYSINLAKCTCMCVGNVFTVLNSTSALEHKLEPELKPKLRFKCISILLSDYAAYYNNNIFLLRKRSIAINRSR